MENQLKTQLETIENYIENYGPRYEYLEIMYNIADIAINQGKLIDFGLEVTLKVKQHIEKLMLDTVGKDIWAVIEYCREQNATMNEVELYWNTIKLESYYLLESFIEYMEKKRPLTKKFYYPRKKTLQIVVNDLQDLENGCIRFYGLSMPSRVGKSTICIFFLAWIALRKPNSHSAMGGHSGILAKGFYKELMNLFTTEEYTFAELFEYWHPGCVVLRDKSADEFTITLDQPDRFATITCRGIDGTWTGAVDVSRDGYLYVDDLVRDREHSLSPLRMESTFQEYLNKMVDRKNDGAKELMVGTLWNVLDPLNRIREQYEGNSEYRFRKIPALDENDESNFDYVFNGFSTEYYREMRSRLDKAEWMAKFQQQPFVREGLLFPSEELKYFDGNISTERKSVVAICDPAFGGADSLSMPICYIDTDDKKYIIDWVHKQGTQAVTVPIIVDKIVAHYITELHIEQNSGGKLLTDSIKAEMQRRDVRHCKIVPYYASTKMPKDEKIKAYSDWVKENFMFLMPNSAFSMLEDIEYKRNEQYQKAMDELSMYTSEGKNFHDDAPDSITQFAIVLGKKQRQTVVLDGFI